MAVTNLPYNGTDLNSSLEILERTYIKYKEESKEFTSGINLTELVVINLLHDPDFSTAVLALAQEYKYGTPVFTKRWKQRLLRKKKVGSETSPKEQDPIQEPTNKTPSHEVIISNFEECY